MSSGGNLVSLRHFVAEGSSNQQKSYVWPWLLVLSSSDFVCKLLLLCVYLFIFFIFIWNSVYYSVISQKNMFLSGIGI